MLEKLKSMFNRSAAGKNTEPVQQAIVGIDISHSYVRTIALKKKNKKWSLDKISTKSLDDSYENEEKRTKTAAREIKMISII